MGWSFWLVTGIILLIVEIVTPGIFFFACLSIGAFAAGAAAFLRAPAWAPWIVFSVVSVLSIYLIRPLAKRLMKAPRQKTNVDALLGQKVWVTEPIEPPNAGMVKVDGEIWRARAQERIAAGEYAEVLSIDGTTLSVRKTAL